jgi:hypothetical protein
MAQQSQRQSHFRIDDEAAISPKYSGSRDPKTARTAQKALPPAEAGPEAGLVEGGQLVRHFDKAVDEASAAAGQQPADSLPRFEQVSVGQSASLLAAGLLPKETCK